MEDAFPSAEESPTKRARLSTTQQQLEDFLPASAELNLDDPDDPLLSSGDSTLSISNSSTRTTITVVDPIVAVARKTLHTEDDNSKNNTENDSDEDDDNDCKPSAIPGKDRSNNKNMAHGSNNRSQEEDYTGNNKQINRQSLSEFNTDILCRITSFLNPTGLLLELGATNRFFLELCRQNCAGWDTLCDQTWRTKCHVLPAARREPNKVLAYRMALQDARQRYWITEDELCFDSINNLNKPTVWSFRFKESAGTDWTASDPWYRGQPCRKLVFFRDGTVREVQQPHLTATTLNEVNNHATTTTTTTTTETTPTITSETIRFTLVDPPMRMTWRFLTRPMDLPQRPHGSYVRFTVGGRDVPTYAVRRSPTHNWGFVMESCWGVYASFELPPRRVPTVLQPRVASVSSATNSSSVVGAAANGRPPRLARRGVAATSDATAARAAELQDDTLRLTNEVQWREAFLYNVGARVLPEGDQAADEFDRAWHG